MASAPSISREIAGRWDVVTRGRGTRSESRARGSATYTATQIERLTVIRQGLTERGTGFNILLKI
ncbi:hypothetical protein GCM10027444_43350 [Actinopolyspora lacussalsi]